MSTPVTGPTAGYTNVGQLVALDPNAANPVTVAGVDIPGAFTIDDGADTTQGATTDAAVVNPASAGTVVALLKGILTQQLLLVTAVTALVTILTDVYDAADHAIQTTTITP